MKLSAGLPHAKPGLAVATVLTVYGIETAFQKSSKFIKPLRVATVLTVYGIETPVLRSSGSTSLVATVLTVYGIETSSLDTLADNNSVATVLTVYGIETYFDNIDKVVKAII